ncbi:hypothetical protein OAN22_02030 [Alphaproteobacteria bacterium]|nr:hypothetical protein [Alphaproteobacteria bacterium]
MIKQKLFLVFFCLLSAERGHGALSKEEPHPHEAPAKAFLNTIPTVESDDDVPPQKLLPVPSQHLPQLKPSGAAQTDDILDA